MRRSEKRETFPERCQMLVDGTWLERRRTQVKAWLRSRGRIVSLEKPSYSAEVAPIRRVRCK